MTEHTTRRYTDGEVSSGVHPPKALGYRSPREYITETRAAPSGI